MFKTTLHLKDGYWQSQWSFKLSGNKPNNQLQFKAKPRALEQEGEWEHLQNN